MKKTFAIIGVAALLATVLIPTTARAFDENPYASRTVIDSLVIQANMTSNVLSSAYFIDASKQDKVGIQSLTSWNLAGDAAGANTNLTFKLAPSVDGVAASADTNSLVTLVALDRQLTAGDVNRTTTNTPAANGIKGWFVFTIQNNAIGGIATNTLKQSVKIGKP